VGIANSAQPRRYDNYKNWITAFQSDVIEAGLETLNPLVPATAIDG